MIVSGMSACVCMHMHMYVLCVLSLLAEQVIPPARCRVHPPLGRQTSCT